MFQKMIAGEFELELHGPIKRIEREANPTRVSDPLAKTSLKSVEHQYFPWIVDTFFVSLTVFPMEHKKYLFFLKSENVFRAKVVATWKEFCEQLAELMKFLYDPNFRTGKGQNLPFKKNFLDAFRQSFPELCPINWISQ